VAAPCWQWIACSPVRKSVVAGRSTQSLAVMRETLGGTCEHCGKGFRYYLVSNGMNGSFHAFCERCGRTVMSESYVDPKTITFDPCICGAAISFGASPRCPHCEQPLSAEGATLFLERNAPGYAGGWRWQRSWRGEYAFVIEDRLLYNHHWTKPKERWWQVWK